jgi:uncharacterized membrane protein YhaH (DUF805 family)
MISAGRGRDAREKTEGRPEMSFQDAVRTCFARLLFFFVLRGTVGANRFGPDPLETTARPV